MYEVAEIKNIRKRVGMTQGELAKLADVSQSMIAKIESGLLDPSYSNAKKIFAALDSLTNKKNIQIEQVMVKKIISVSPNDTLKDAIETMKKYGISQTPVIDGNSVAGFISEGILLDAIMNTHNPKARISEVMSEAPPIVAVSADIDAASHLLKYYPLVLVSDKGKLVGVLTKADLLQNMLKK